MLAIYALIKNEPVIIRMIILIWKYCFYGDDDDDDDMMMMMISE